MLNKIQAKQVENVVRAIHKC